MKKYLSLLVVLLTTLFSVNAMAWDPPPSPKPVGAIVDQVGILTPAAIQHLNAQLRQINTSSANEIGVLVIPSLNGMEIRDVGYATAKAWGVGQRDLDNGVMIIWSPGDRKVGIETGKGIEGDLPDLKCNDIIRNVIAPEFKLLHYEAGLKDGFAAIASAVADHRAELAQRNKDRAANPVPTTVPTTDTVPSTATQHSSGGCDISGAPIAQASAAGTVVLFVLGLLVVLWVVRAVFRAASKKQYEEAAFRMALIHQELERRVAARQPTPTPVQARPPVSLQVDAATMQPFTGSLTSVSTEPLTTNPACAAALETGKQLEGERRDLAEKAAVAEELRQEAARLRRQQEAAARRREREEEEAAAIAVVASAVIAGGVVAASVQDDDNSDEPESDDDDNSSTTGSSCGSNDDKSNDDSFGGGDFGGGGSSDDY